MPAPLPSRRRFLVQSAATALLGASAQAAGGKVKLIAYVGTYTSPLKNMRPTQVDLPPGNGRGIHLF